MARLKRTARSRAIPRIGYARRGVVHEVPDDLVEQLLATGEWERVGEPRGAPAPARRTSTGRAGAPDARQPDRLTEPAPSEPAAPADAEDLAG